MLIQYRSSFEMPDCDDKKKEFEFRGLMRCMDSNASMMTQMKFRERILASFSMCPCAVSEDGGRRLCSPAEVLPLVMMSFMPRGLLFLPNRSHNHASAPEETLFFFFVFFSFIMYICNFSLLLTSHARIPNSRLQWLRCQILSIL